LEDPWGFLGHFQMCQSGGDTGMSLVSVEMLPLPAIGYTRFLGSGISASNQTFTTCHRYDRVEHLKVVSI